jgi:hypothetical protein
VARHRGPLLCGLAALLFAVLGMAPPPGAPAVVGPTAILYMDADTVFFIRSQAWQSAETKQEEKLLLKALRFKYWSERLPPDMKLTFDTLGYPSGRVLLKPVGHTEEWWYYRMLDPPLRFRDGVLLDPDRYEAYLARR